MPKLRTVRSYIDKLNPSCELEVDGGINAETAKLCAEAGADVMAAGSAFFSAADKPGFVKAVKALETPPEGSAK